MESLEYSVQYPFLAMESLGSVRFQGGLNEGSSTWRSVPSKDTSYVAAAVVVVVVVVAALICALCFQCSICFPSSAGLPDTVVVLPPQQNHHVVERSIFP